MPQFWKPGASDVNSQNSPAAKKPDNHRRPTTESKIQASNKYGKNGASIQRKSMDGNSAAPEIDGYNQRDNDNNSNNKTQTSTTTLSKSVMSMKFMKRKTDDIRQITDESAKKKAATEAMWSNRPTNISSESSFCKLVCEVELEDPLTFFPGRRSFGGFNKSVEKQYQSYLESLKFDKLVSKSSKFDVDDEEMLERYQTLIGLPRGPNQGRREQQSQAQNNHKRIRNDKS